ncbi:Cytosolic phospholipase A2 zeta [Aphanomyces cochlioides]|nr:Cytosolic phospholipase A2 zeta [Aphanomyces cochlioides]
MEKSNVMGNGNTELIHDSRGVPANITAEQVARLVQRLTAAQDRLTKLARVEKAIGDFYGEVATNAGHLYEADDSMRPIPTAAEGDTLALVNSLRAYVRVQLAFKEDYEMNLKTSLHAVTTTQKRDEASAKEDIARLTRQVDALQEDKKTLLSQMEETESVKAAVFQQSMAALESARTETAHVARQLTECKAELKKLDDTCRRQEALLAEQDQTNAKLSRDVDSLKRSLQLGESVGGAVAKTKSSDDAGRRAIVAQDAEMRHANLKIAHLEAENQANREQIKDLKAKLHGYSSSAQALAFTKAQKDAARFKERVKDVETKMTAVEATLMKTRGVLADKDAKLQALKAEYDKLFAALQHENEQRQQHAPPQHEQQLRQPETVSNEEASRIANENQYVTGFYKAKLEHQAAEILALRKQIKKMLASKHRQFFDQSLEKKAHERLLQRYAELKAVNDKHTGSNQEPQTLHHAASMPTLTAAVDPKDMVKLVRRNHFLERFFRDHCGVNGATPTTPNTTATPAVIATTATTTTTTQDISIAIDAPPRQAPSSASTASKKPRPASAIVKPRHIGASRQSFVVGSLVREI